MAVARTMPSVEPDPGEIVHTGPRHRTERRLLLPLLLVGVMLLGGCRDVEAGRLAALPVLTTVPEGAVVVERRSGSEIGSWPTTPVMANVEYRVADGADIAPALDKLRRVADETGWEFDPSQPEDQVRAVTSTRDGRVRLSAFSPLDSDRIIVTVTLD